MKTKTKKLILNVICIVIVVLVAIFAAVLIAGRASNKIVFVFKRTSMWILTPSMEPAIPAKSFILVQKIDAKDVKVGDVIVFYSDDPALKGNLNTHRVTEIIGDNQEFKTKGDNNYAEDAYTAKAQNVVGVYKKNLPFLTVIGRIFMTPVGAAVGIFVLAALAFATYLPDVIAAARKKSGKDDDKKRIDELIAQEVKRLKEQNAAVTDQTEQKIVDSDQKVDE